MRVKKNSLLVETLYTHGMNMYSASIILYINYRAGMLHTHTQLR